MREGFLGLGLVERSLSLGDAELTVGVNAVGLPNIPAVANVATVQVQAQPVRMRLSGGAPTAVLGIAWAAGDLFEIEGRELIQAARFIREGGVDATLFVTYFVRGEEVQDGTS